MEQIDMTPEERQSLIDMALRELLMTYYKETGNGRLTSIPDSSLVLVDSSGERRYQYQRRLAEVRKPKDLIVGNLTLAQLSRQPNEFVLCVDPMATAETKRLAQLVKGFLHSYLPSVSFKVSPDALKEVPEDIFHSVHVSIRSESSGGVFSENLRQYRALWSAEGLQSVAVDESIDLDPPQFYTLRRPF